MTYCVQEVCLCIQRTEKMCSGKSDALDCIIPDFLYIGNFLESKSKRLLRGSKIDVVINCTTSLKNRFEAIFEYKRFGLNDTFEDGELLFSILEESTAYIAQKREENKRVFVHCMQGVSRSVSIVMAYLIAEMDMSFDEALAYIRQNRKKACPNIAFAMKMKKWAKLHRKGGTNLEESMKEFLVLCENSSLSEMRREALEFVKQALQDKEDPETEFAKVLTTIVVEDAEMRDYVFKLIHSMSHDLSMLKTYGVFCKHIEDVYLDTPEVVKLYGEFCFAPAMRTRLITIHELEAMLSSTDEEIKQDIMNCLGEDPYLSESVFQRQDSVPVPVFS